MCLGNYSERKEVVTSFIWIVYLQFYSVRIMINQKNEFAHYHSHWQIWKKLSAKVDTYGKEVKATFGTNESLSDWTIENHLKLNRNKESLNHILVSKQLLKSSIIYKVEE